MLIVAAAALAGQRVARVRWSTTRSWIRAGAPFLVAAGAIVAYTRGDRIVVAIIDGPQAAGDYSAAYNLIMIVAVAGAAVASAVLPRLLRESRHGLEQVWVRRAMLIVVALAPCVVVLWALAPWLISILYGPEYQSAGAVLRGLSPLALLYVLNPFLTSNLIAMRRQRRVAAIAVTNLCVAAIAYPLLVSRSGPVGAAWASVLIELVGMLLTGSTLRYAKPRVIARESDSAGQ